MARIGEATLCLTGGAVVGAGLARGGGGGMAPPGGPSETAGPEGIGCEDPRPVAAEPADDASLGLAIVAGLTGGTGFEAADPGFATGIDFFSAALRFAAIMR